jgi:hypothetical protein
LAGGSFAASSEPTGLAVTISVDGGNFAIAGNELGLSAERLLSLTGASILLTGNATGLRKSSKLVLAGGSFTMTGQATDLRNYALRVTSSGDVRVLAGDEAGNRRRI